MIRLLFVGEGERDHLTVPRLVERILGYPVLEETRPWARLRGSGYEKKLRFAQRQAMDAKTAGLVATTDEDRSPGAGRCKRLVTARQRLRESAPAFPMALGCPRPHLEAWLLDDPVAVRRELGLKPGTPVPNVRKVDNPKRALESLLRRGDHAAETGFEKFVADVVDEIGPLVKDR